MIKAIKISDHIFKDKPKDEFFNHVVKVMNSKSAEFLDRKDIKNSLEILKHCEIMIKKRKSSSSEVKVETYNNLSLWYRKRGMFNISLEYIEKALKVCIREDYPSGRTYLNYGALYSVIGK